MATYARTEAPTYWVGSHPSPLVLELDSDIELTAVTTVGVALSDPAGVAVAGGSAVLEGTAEPPTITVTLPANPFTTGGLYSLALTLTAPTFTEVVEPVALVVQTADGWLSLDAARQMWPQAPDDDVTLAMLLDSAKAACVAFAPVIDPAVPIPASYRQAQFQQARSLWLAMSSTTDSRIGDEGFAITVFPLDWNVKQLLRPRGAPVMW